MKKDQTKTVPILICPIMSARILDAVSNTAVMIECQQEQCALWVKDQCIICHAVRALSCIAETEMIIAEMTAEDR